MEKTAIELLKECRKVLLRGQHDEQMAMISEIEAYLSTDGGKRMDTGGSAFPSTIDRLERGMDGMSLRDYFAGQALQGLCAAYIITNPDDKNTLAQLSYVLADAMLISRNSAY
jgi:hypothetical protein